jgi:hypothetical protein
LPETFLQAEQDGDAKDPRLSQAREAGEAVGKIKPPLEPVRAEFILERRSPAALWLNLKQLPEPLDIIVVSSPLQGREKP